MDRERLKEVHQTDLTESRVNEDFVDWLKNKGPTWLLVVLVAMCAYLAIIRYRQHKSDFQSEAWAALGSAELPGSFEDVAEEYGNVGQVASVARLQAADDLLRSVQMGTPLGATPPVPDPTNPVPPPPPEQISDEERSQYLSRASGLYDKVIERDDGSLGLTLFTVNALNGKAAIAECEGDVERARDLYEQAATRADAFYPGLALQARARAENTDRFTEAVTLMTRQEVTTLNGTPPTRTPVTIEESLREMLLPEESGG